MNETTTVYGTESCDDNLGLSMEWWKVFAARLLFVVVFEHVVFIIKITVEYLIPDVPTKIFVQQQREKYLLRKALLNDLASNRETVNGHSAAARKAAANGDSIETAFQPGAFTDNDDEEEPRKLSNSSFVTAQQGSESVLNMKI
ncbi:hypothetical protein NECAME_14697 [Necator americanus]|uniref:Anoctamin n=1 Tax=Necator americanus TaxID=51031 RepID=W2SLP9_NECAM|nr:hypothetical protein NECAME_14697 [Necator americanus]ETN70550.1 hypothetical protein NECAME_14697 [Necator americanus]